MQNTNLEMVFVCKIFLTLWVAQMASLVGQHPKRPKWALNRQPDGGAESISLESASNKGYLLHYLATYSRLHRNDDGVLKLY